MVLRCTRNRQGDGNVTGAAVTCLRADLYPPELHRSPFCRWEHPSWFGRMLSRGETRAERRPDPILHDEPWRPAASSGPHPLPRRPMRTIRSSLTAALLISGLAGCTSLNVRLGDHAAAVRPLDGGTRLVRIYYDRDGDLYPQPLLDVKVPNSELDDRHQFKLQTHFEEHRKLYRLDRQPSLWDEVIDSLGLPAAAPDSVLWTAIQDSLTGRAVAAIERATGADGERKRTLVVLIHGFNNVPKDAEAGYEAARLHLDSTGYASPSRTAYLQVYWDGLKDPLGLPFGRKRSSIFPL
jgi:hypothetical protein